MLEPVEVLQERHLVVQLPLQVPDQSHLVKEAQELSRQLGDSFVDVTKEKLKQIDDTCESLHKKKRKG